MSVLKICPFIQVSYPHTCLTLQLTLADGNPTGRIYTERMDTFSYSPVNTTMSASNKYTNFAKLLCTRELFQCVLPVTRGARVQDINGGHFKWVGPHFQKTESVRKFTRCYKNGG